MKLLLLAITVAVMSTTATAADVGVSVSIGQPGFYGRIDIGDYPYPHPQVIYSQPRIIEHVHMEREPIYLRVPPGHRNDWGKHCRQYNACGERVYFVQDSWYQREYAPNYREYHRDGYDGRGERGNDDRRGGRGDDHQGNQGNGHSGKNHGNGHR